RACNRVHAWVGQGSGAAGDRVDRSPGLPRLAARLAPWLPSRRRRDRSGGATRRLGADTPRSFARDHPAIRRAAVVPASYLVAPAVGGPSGSAAPTHPAPERGG